MHCELLFICGSPVYNSILTDQSVCPSSPENKSTPLSGASDKFNTKVHKWQSCLKRLYCLFSVCEEKNLPLLLSSLIESGSKITALPKQPFPMAKSLKRWYLHQQNYLLIERALSLTVALEESPHQIAGVSARSFLVGARIASN